MSEPDKFFTGGTGKKVSTIRVLFLTGMIFGSLAVGFGLGYMAGK